MKIKVRTLRKMIREALGDVYQAEPDPFGSRFAKPDEEPKTMRGGVGMSSRTNDDSESGVPTQRGGAGMPPQTNDDFDRAVPTQRGMNLEPTIEDLFGGWDEHVGTDVLFDEVEPSAPIVEPAKVEVPAKKRSHKKKVAPAEVQEMKLGLSSGHSAARADFTPDSLFSDTPFERDSESDMDDEFSLDHGEELVPGGKGIQTAKLRGRR